MTSQIPFSTLGILLLCLHLGPSCMAAPELSCPNIILIFSDDQGMHDVGCYGSEIMTPRLDQLASDGMRFTQFYAASSICTPSRYGLLTGRYPHRSRDQLLGALMFLADEDQRRGLRPGETTYVSQLKEAGYQTALVGKWHLGHGAEEFWPTRHGFETFFGHTGGCVDFFTLNYGNRPDWYRNRELEKPDGYATDVITEEAIKILRQSRSTDRPLYLHVAYNAPHFGKGWNAVKQTPENIMQPKREDVARVGYISAPLRQSFAAKVVGMDQGIGKLLDVVDELKMRENTLIIFMTDHGGDPNYGGSNTPFRGGKATLFEGGIRVPCIARWPQQIPANSVSQQVACAIDLYATFSDLAGYEKKGTDGISMLPILKGNRTPLPRTLIWRTGSHQSLGRRSWKAVREGEWKWVSQPDKPPMLFDLGNDPHETRNVATSQPNIARRLQALSE